jgi:hypothetical protein
MRIASVKRTRSSRRTIAARTWPDSRSTTLIAARGAGIRIAFEPLVTPAEHGASTETFEVRFPSKGILRLKSTTATTHGSSTIEATAQGRAWPAK